MRQALSWVAAFALLSGCCELGSAFGTRPVASEAPPTEVAPATSPPPAAVDPAPPSELAAVNDPPAVIEATEPVAATEEAAGPAAGATITRDVAAADLETWRAAEGGLLRRAEIHTAPSESGGGVRVLGIGASDPLAALGFQNGDIIHTLNEMSVSDEDRLRGAFEQLRVTPYFRAEIIRRGAHETLYVEVRE